MRRRLGEYFSLQDQGGPCGAARPQLFAPAKPSRGRAAWRPVPRESVGASGPIDEVSRGSEKMSSPDGQVSETAGGRASVASTGNRGPVCASPFPLVTGSNTHPARAVQDREGGGLAGCPVQRHDWAVPGRRDAERPPTRMVERTMDLPMSRSAIERLGKRLEKSDTASVDDLASLRELLVAYDEALAVAVNRVQTKTDFNSTSRVKTTGTILDKVRRHGGSILKSMQDIAGMRIVGDFNRIAQDKISASISELFSNGARPPKIVDRRISPSSGYRAVHLVVHVDSVPVEIQIRTRLQHQWAEFYEKLGDKFGRGIRYGEPVELLKPRAVQYLQDNPEASTELGSNFIEACTVYDELTANSLRAVNSLSELINLYEQAEVEIGSSPTLEWVREKLPELIDHQIVPAIDNLGNLPHPFDIIQGMVE